MKNKLANLLLIIIEKFLKKRENMFKISYSQSGEDLIVKSIFDRLKIYTPTYIDVGAHHPYLISNTAMFYHLGSRGINIEPNINLIKAFELYRPGDKNVNVGVSKQAATLDFYIMNEKSLSSFSKEEADLIVREGGKIEEIKKVNTLNLQTILDQYSGGKFPDFLSLDVEGFDEEILESIDFKNNFPIVICVESISFSVKGKGEKKRDLIDFLINNGYLLHADTYINSIFVRKEIWEAQ